MGQYFSFWSEKRFLRDHSVDETDINKIIKNADALYRLQRVMEGDLIYQPDQPQDTIAERESGNIVVLSVGDEFDVEFHKFEEMCPQWKDDGPDENRVIFFAQYEHLANLKVLRRQTSGLCYMHAPVVLQHYLVSISGSTECKMINIADYINRTWKRDALSHYLLNDSGGNSLEFLKQIASPNGELNTSKFTINLTPKALYDETMKEITNRLREKPALVSQFRVYKDFQESNDVSFVTPVSKDIKFVGLHALVLIGVRALDNGRHMFLLQNWWKSRYFIEVSSEYFIKTAQAVITFVDDDLIKIPDEFPTVRAAYAETSDISERVNELLENI